MLVREKEDRIYIMLRMNGLSTATYYVSHYIHCFVMQLLNGLVFLLVGTVMRQKFFTETGPGVVFITLLLWTNVCVAFAFFLSLFFNKSRFALSTSSFRLILNLYNCSHDFCSRRCIMYDKRKYWIDFQLRIAACCMVCLALMGILSLFGIDWYSK